MADDNTESVNQTTNKRKAPHSAWKPGQSGNPNGRPPAGWTWAELLREAGEEIEPKTGKQFKQLVTKRIWLECMNGNVGAIKELFNRMEGLPKQNMDLNINEFQKFIMDKDDETDESA